MRLPDHTRDALILVLRQQVGTKWGSIADASRRWNVRQDTLKNMVNGKQDVSPEVLEKAGIVMVPFALKPPECPNGDVVEKVRQWAQAWNITLTETDISSLATLFYGD